MIYAAHIRKDQNKNPIAIQTVEDHCRNTAEKAAFYASDFNCKHLGYMTGLFHDMGKMQSDFDDYIHGKNKMQKGEIDHCFPGAKYLISVAENISDPNVQNTAELIARVILTHHGLRDWLSPDGQNTFEIRLKKTEGYCETVRNFQSVISEEETKALLSEASNEYAAILKNLSELARRPDGNNNVKREFYRGLLERLLLSALVDADRTDTAEFASASTLEKGYNLPQIWGNAEHRMDDLCGKFAENTDHISLCRRSISDRCYHFADHPVGICRLVVPTGGGKTLSSLRFALRYCQEQNMNARHIYYIAPFMSILEQNSDVIKSIMGEDNVLEHYSDMISQLSAAKDSENELSDYELKTQKYTDPVITTTMVQFLNTLFSGNMTSVRRMHCFCNSVIIIDEIQSLPVKCISLFNLTMNFLSNICGTTIILCSATQPALTTVKYPILLDSNSSMTGDYTNDFAQFKRNEIVPIQIKCGMTNEDAADFCIEQFRQIGSTLFVVNTKATAVSIYNLINERVSENTHIMYLTTNMCPEHRRNKLKTLRELLNEHKPVICVTTQLIEAGVDISFPCVIRSLAGLDNAAQAAGRCNRNGEFSECMKVFLVLLSEEKIGSLKDIQKAQNASRDMLLAGTATDLQSSEVMEKYFRSYYKEQEEEHDYRIGTERGKAEETLLNLLSTDKNRKIYRNCKKHDNQAFKTAGSLFKVIDQNTKQIIVPYDAEAEEEILDLDSELSPGEIIKHLRVVSKYSVSVYENMYKRLCTENAINFLSSGALALKKEFYDDSLGVLTEAKPMDLLLF